ncbi:hypothetical protein J6590_007849 [Homalodisca vitripennis]|nr:hypothetical protein J6590_007849 [Homalodisca vitripennis]
MEVKTSTRCNNATALSRLQRKGTGNFPQPADTFKESADISEELCSTQASSRPKYHHLMDNHQGRTGALIGRGPREKGRGITGGDLRAVSRKIGSGCGRRQITSGVRCGVGTDCKNVTNMRGLIGMLFTLGVAWGFHRGVVFEKEGDVLLTDSHWTIVLQYNLTEVEEENQKLSTLLTRVKDGGCELPICSVPPWGLTDEARRPPGQSSISRPSKRLYALRADQMLRMLRGGASRTRLTETRVGACRPHAPRLTLN